MVEIGDMPEASAVASPPLDAPAVTLGSRRLAGIRRAGRRARLAGQHQDDRVQVPVDGLDALEVGVDDLARGHLAACDQLRQLIGAATPQLIG